MLPKKKRKIAKVLSLVVIIASIMVIIGWIFDNSILKSISPAWVSMKFDTAIAFLLSGITLYFIIRTIEGEFDKAQVALSITTLIILLVAGILFSSTLLGIHTGAEGLFIQEEAGSVKTVTPGRPSLPTMLNFVLIAFAGILTLVNPDKVQLRLKSIGYVVGTTGALALVGYFFNAPLLYYFIEGRNSAMACNTAILFVLTGIGLLCLSD
jgi:hypothetical protein